ncbi:MAG: NHL repeat-containing protein [Thermomicrobiales bacterium]
MDDRQFDDLSRRIGDSPLSRLPRRGLIAALGGATLASAWRLDDDADAKKKNKNKKCKKEGKGCDKKKCKKQDKKCCCNNLKCQDSVCVGKGGSCPTEVSFNNAWGSSGSGNGAFNSPFGITIDADGYLYVTDTGNSRVQVFSANGTFQYAFGSQGNEDDEFQTPQGIAYSVDNDGNARLNIADQSQSNSNRTLRRFRLNGNFSKYMLSGMTDPVGVAADSNDRVWAVDVSSPYGIFLFNSNGDYVMSWALGGSGALSSPQGIAVFKDGSNTYVYVADTGNNRVVKFQYTDNSGSGLQYVTSAGSTGSGSSNFNRPTGIAVDDCGNLWVADQINNRVQILDKNLTFKSRFTASMNRPTGVAINEDTLYVVNQTGNKVQRFSLS